MTYFEVLRSAMRSEMASQQRHKNRLSCRSSSSAVKSFDPLPEQAKTAVFIENISCLCIIKGGGTKTAFPPPFRFRQHPFR